MIKKNFEKIFMDYKIYFNFKKFNNDYYFLINIIDLNKKEFEKLLKLNIENIKNDLSIEINKIEKNIDNLILEFYINSDLKYLYTEIIEPKNNNTSLLLEIIENQNKRINFLEKECNFLKNNNYEHYNNNHIYLDSQNNNFNNKYYLNNFDISNFRLSENNKLSCPYLKNNLDIECIIILNDQRICFSNNSNIIIYNFSDFKLDILIKCTELYKIYYLNQLPNDYLISISNNYKDKNFSLITIYKIYGFRYELVQKFSDNKWTWKSIKLFNSINDFAICNWKHEIRFYTLIQKNKDIYYNFYKIIKDERINSGFENLIQITNNDFVTFSAKLKCIFFWNIKTLNEYLNKIDNIELNSWNQNMEIINEKNLLIGGINYLYIIDIENKNISNSILLDNNIENNLKISSILKINNNIYLIGVIGGIYQFNFLTKKIIKKEMKNISFIKSMKLINDKKLLIGSNLNHVLLFENINLNDDDYYYYNNNL